MSIDTLQDKIRKTKNPSMISLELAANSLPPHILESAESVADAYRSFFIAILEGLKGTVGAVRVPWGMFTLLGVRGMEVLAELLSKAKELGYYVLLDGLDFSTPTAAENVAAAVFGNELWPCDGIVVPVYLGSDCIKPFLDHCKDKKKDIFVQVKTSNKSAPELQDLRTGSRQVHTAAMDLVNRYGEPFVRKFGYSRVAAIIGAGAPDAIRTMRAKYQKVFFMTDGYDYPNGNAKNCSFAFDRLGHGAVACAGSSVTAAWQQSESDGKDFVEQAVEAALRMKKNLTRYVTIL
jgi:orotidine-5'-phosphate decarboxylase